LYTAAGKTLRADFMRGGFRPRAASARAAGCRPQDAGTVLEIGIGTGWKRFDIQPV